MQYSALKYTFRVFLDKTIESDIGFRLPVMWRKHIRSGLHQVILDGSGLDGLSMPGLAWIMEAHKALAMLHVTVVLAHMPIETVRWAGAQTYQMLLPGVTNDLIEQQGGVSEEMLSGIELVTHEARQCGTIQHLTVSGELDAPRDAAERILQAHIDGLVIDCRGLHHCNSQGISWMVAVLDLAIKRGIERTVMCDDIRIVKVFQMVTLHQMATLVDEHGKAYEIPSAHKKAVNAGYQGVAQTLHIEGHLEQPRSGPHYLLRPHIDRLVLNCCGLTYATSAGLSWLVKVLNLAKERSVECLLTCDDKRMLELFEKIGFERLTKIIDRT